jgi:phosphoribosyl 1,2-cyclic phosphate phosphodiesterase
MKETFLGTGANGGVPQIDCSCDNCELATKFPLMKRLRSSVLVETSQGKIILDCGPDFRQQLLLSGLKLQDLSLIIVTHLHFDHSNGLMELSAGKKLEVPVLIPAKSRIAETAKGIMSGITFLHNAGFIRLISEIEAEGMGVKLLDVPHDPYFPTVGVAIEDDNKNIWYSPDVADITPDMSKMIDKANLVIFDSTFLNDKIYPASVYGHLTIEKSVRELAEYSQNVIYSHINHSEDPVRVRDFISGYKY